MGKEPRSPERIEPILEKLKEAWEIYPDMRLGQLFMTCAGTGDMFGIEDEEFLEHVQRYIDAMKKAIEHS